MFFKKLLEKLVILFKQIFSIEEIPNINALRDVSFKAHSVLRLAKSKKDLNGENTVEFMKLLKSIEKCADIMRYNCSPEIFISAYSKLINDIEQMCNIKTDKEFTEYAKQIKNIVNSMPKSYTECEGADNLYYSVTFRSKHKTYYYLAGNKKYKVGQYVIAPAGIYMEPAVVRIVRTERFEDKPPMPIELLKTITTSAI